MAEAAGSGLLKRFCRVLEATSPADDACIPEGPWIVGFSHGADSSALLALLHAYRDRQASPAVLVPIHVDHGLRPGSAAEARRARNFCEQLGLPCEVHRLGHGTGESWARQERYRIFRERATSLGATRLYLAHHRDDDLETLLFRLQRGTGPLGLAGIPASRSLDPSGGCSTRIHRPLLTFPKALLVDWLEECRLTWIEDPSNAQTAHTPRNRIRHQLVPELRRSPRAWKALLDLDEEAKRFAACVQRELASLQVGETDAQALDLPLAPLQEVLPWAFDRHLSLLLEARGQPRPSRALLQQARTLLQEALPSGKRVEARGRWRLERRKKSLHLRLLAP